jgi:hypothetical protein
MYKRRIRKDKENKIEKNKKKEKEIPHSAV